MLFRKRKIVSIFVSLSLFSPCFYLQAKEDKTNLGHIQVSDNKEKDKQGYSHVYEKDVSNVYLGKELLERYQGVSPADLLKSAIGVYSGEARNGERLILIFVVFKGKVEYLLLWMGQSRQLPFIEVIVVHLIVTILILI